MGFMEHFFETARECWMTIHSGGWPELGWWSYILLALLVATEGPVSTLLGAAAAATGILDIRYVFLFAFFGNVFGDCLWYSIGYVNDLKRIHRFARWFGIRGCHIDRLEREMHTHGTKLIALSKVAIGLIIPTLVAAGLARVPWRRWFPLVLSIEIAWTLLMVTVGFHGAALITQLERGLQLTGVVALLLLIGSVIWYGRHFFEQREASLDRGAASQTFSSNGIGAGASVSRDAQYATDRPVSPVLPSCKRNAYKQLVGRLSARRSPRAASSARRLTDRSLAARSAMTRAMACRPTLSPLSAPRDLGTVQIHFARN